MVWLRMFIADRLIYVELPKTACTHIGKLLALVVPGEQRGKHNKPSQAEFDRRPVFLGSVRNPWAWYVSLWAYGCQQEGMLWEALTHGRGSVRGLGWRAAPIYAGRRWLHSLRQRPAEWQRLYSDVQDVQAFRTWLRWLHEPARRWDSAERFALHACAERVGLLTYRYLDLFCRGGFRSIADLESLRAFDARANYLDHVIRTEHLEQDLLMVLERLQISISDEQRSQIFGGGRSNPSRGKRSRWQDYYDQASIELVAQRDRFITERFGYTPPTL